MGSITSKSKGFTLVELLLVLVVLAVVLSLASAVLPDRNVERLGSEASRLVRVLQALQLEAMSNRTQTSLVLQEDGYRALILNLYSLEWEDSRLSILAPRNLQQQGLSLSLISDSPSSSETSALALSGEENPLAIIFDASGASEPYQLQLADMIAENLAATLSSNGLEPPAIQ